jgi:adenylylsulfate kinase
MMGGGGPGGTMWLTGLPSSGKSTLAAALAERLRAEGRAVEVLDGDEMRRRPAPELGYSKRDRDLNVARIGYMAELLARHGVLVLAPVIAPYAEARDAVRRAHQESGVWFAEVHVATSLDVCRRRDVKGLYAGQAAGTLSGLTGVDDPYEVPAAPELRIETEGRTVAESVEQLYRLITSHFDY